MQQRGKYDPNPILKFFIGQIFQEISEDKLLVAEL